MKKKLDYLIEELIKEDPNLSNIEIPTNIDEKKDLYRALRNIRNPKQISAGDIMLYGNNCLVIFYETFNTQYSYTKIGHIDNLSNLGNSSISVKFIIH